ncbi:MAG: hypothetical protein JWQ70_2326 [Aeromicrobium sp.]|nr:hypothetical protein [Aeromicrobium sp.]
MKWIVWFVGIAGTIAAIVGVAFFVHRDTGWSAGVESGAGVGAAILTAITAAASATAAKESRAASQEARLAAAAARRSIALHSKPVFVSAIFAEQSGQSGVVLNFEAGGGLPIRDGRATWETPDGTTHSNGIDGSLVLPGTALKSTGEPDIRFLDVEWTDSAANRWRVRCAPFRGEVELIEAGD